MHISLLEFMTAFTQAPNLSTPSDAHQPLFLFLSLEFWVRIDKAKETATNYINGRCLCEGVQGSKRVLEEERLREAEWVGPEAEDTRGAAGFG